MNQLRISGENNVKYDSQCKITLHIAIEDGKMKEKSSEINPEDRTICGIE